MSTVQYEVECKQCGFPNAWKEVDCRSNEWEVLCTRCGYVESWKNKSFFSNGRLERGVKEVIYSAGAYFAKWADDGGGVHGSLSETEVEEVAAKMRDDIAAGKLSKESYVTRYSPAAHMVTALVGRVPIHGLLEPENDLREEKSETVGKKGGE